MIFEIPNVEKTLDSIMSVNSTFDGTTRSIAEWVEKHRIELKRNRKLLVNASGKNDIVIMNIVLRDLLVRAITGERAERIYEELIKTFKRKEDLSQANYRKVLKNAKYRWGVNNGTKVISEVVSYLDKSLHWNWQRYVENAETEKKNNYQDDPMLRIQNVGFKLRDLALSNFSPFYAAFDLHVTRVVTRIGWLNFGFPLLGDTELEMGNNPGNDKNYLFLHRLFVLLSEMTKGRYTPVDMDRIFWHFGKSHCGAKPKCPTCPIWQKCPTGKHRI